MDGGQSLTVRTVTKRKVNIFDLCLGSLNCSARFGDLMRMNLA